MSDAPDPRYAIELDAPAGMLAAAERSAIPIARLGDGAVRVGGAIVRRAPSGLVCDCPVSHADPTAAACLHRLLVSRWARGLVPSDAKASGSAPPDEPVALAASPSHSAAALAGETLPPEDLSRFNPLLGRVDALLTDLILWGLDRATEMTLERIESLRLAAEAMGVRPSAPRHAGLGRLAGALSRLGARLQEYMGRVVTTTELDVVAEIAIAHNLLRAIRANTGALPLSDFAGATHKPYLPAPPLDVQGLGMEAWTSPGYAGVTAYVADLRTDRILTRTATRPWGAAVARPPADWAAELADGPAFGKSPRTLRDLASGRFLLSGALVAPDSGRLSGSQETALAQRPVLPQAHPRLRAFMLRGRGDAVRIAKRLVFDPLGRPPHSPPVALLPILSMTASDFDQKTQQLSFQITLPGGTPLGCRLTFRDDRENWIDQLETLTRISPPPRYLFARLALQGGALVVEPLTAYFRDEPPQHLTLG